MTTIVLPGYVKNSDADTGTPFIHVFKSDYNTYTVVTKDYRGIAQIIQFPWDGKPAPESDITEPLPYEEFRVEDEQKNSINVRVMKANNVHELVDTVFSMFTCEPSDAAGIKDKDGFYILRPVRGLSLQNLKSRRKRKTFSAMTQLIQGDARWRDVSLVFIGVRRKKDYPVLGLVQVVATVCEKPVIDFYGVGNFTFYSHSAPRDVETLMLLRPFYAALSEKGITGPMQTELAGLIFSHFSRAPHQRYLKEMQAYGEAYYL